MRAAHALGCRCLRKYSSKFSRHDYTLPQLFACLVVREQMRLSYRGAEALLRDGRAWCRAIGMRGRKTPDHATLARAAGVILKGRRVGKMLDRLADWFMLARLLGDTLAVDSTCHDTHHRSRHYERRCRHYAAGGKRSANTKRSASARRTPKLSLGVDTRSHAVLSAQARAGMGSDAPSFDGLLYDAWRRRGGGRGRLRKVLADAGFDSEANHRIARLDMGLRSLIRAGVGRRSVTGKAPAGHYRRRMAWELTGSQKGKPFGQRAQAETVMSMVKRNLGDALRARTPRTRKSEHLFKAIVHNLMLIRRRSLGSRQSRTRFFSCPLGRRG